MTRQGAWGLGLATFAGDKLLDAWFPEPRLGLDDAPEEPGTREVLGRRGRRLRGRRARGQAARRPLGADRDRDRRPRPSRPPTPRDAYLRLHLLSHRLIRPHGANLDGHLRRAPQRRLDERRARSTRRSSTTSRLRFRAAGQPLAIDRRGQVPADGRLRRPVRRADRRRRPRPPRRPPRRGHDRHARGVRQLQRRHARLLDGRGPHQRRRGGRRRLATSAAAPRSWARCPAAAPR